MMWTCTSWMFFSTSGWGDPLSGSSAIPRKPTVSFSSGSLSETGVRVKVPVALVAAAANVSLTVDGTTV